MTEHERIWLEPAGAPDRCWCQDNQWGEEGVEYVLASTLESLQRENETLRRAQSYTYIGRDGKSVLARDLEARAEAAEAEVKRLQVGVYVETLPAVHLIRVFADDMNERNWDDKRAYIKQQADRIRTALASTGGEHNGN